MADCLRCAEPLSLRELFQAWRKKTKYCSRCLVEIQTLSEKLSQELEQQFRTAGISAQRAQYFRDQSEHHRLPDAFTVMFIQRLDRLIELTAIRKDLPCIRVQRILDTDEYAHHETPVTYQKKNKEVKYIPGTLLLTNKRLYFIGEDGTNSHKVGYNNVSQVRRIGESTFLLQVEQGRGGGIYEVPDPELTTLIIHLASRKWKGYLVALKEQANMQEVPGHIKAEVMRRDQGRCCMCGYQDPYIEFDHIIPRSKGGPNTVGNIQLLCRGCNRRKGDKLLQ